MWSISVFLRDNMDYNQWSGWYSIGGGEEQRMQADPESPKGAFLEVGSRPGVLTEGEMEGEAVVGVKKGPWGAGEGGRTLAWLPGQC